MKLYHNNRIMVSVWAYKKKMFKPNFRYTNTIVRLLARISAAREVVVNSPLIPRWEVSLRRQAIIHSAHSSTRIEGNRLSLEQVSELAQGREIMATRKDKQEALNYLAVLENIGNMVQGGFLREQDVLRLHRTLTNDTLENAGDCGVYRKRYVVVANKVTGEIFFNPPQNKDVPRLMKDLIEWINSEEAKELDPVIEAGIVHYEFVRIHPFVNGNGRAARVLAALILNQRGFDTKQFFCLDDYYDVDRNEYYQALQSVKQDTLDMTNWLEYFAEGVHISIEAVKERVVQLSSERLRKTPRNRLH
jgi:Fic family protein